MSKPKLELKDCPFCGRSAELRHDNEGWSFIVCANDGCYAETGKMLNETQAMNAWNRRVEVGS